MWFGACTSSIGTWMQIAAQSWLVYNISNRPLYLSSTSFSARRPFSAFVVRRSFCRSNQPPKACSGLAGHPTNLRLHLASSRKPRWSVVWEIWCLSFIVGVAQSFGGPAYSALVPTLVKKEDLQNAIALNSIQFNLARVVGPALGGIALVKLGADWCFFLNGLSFLAVIASLLSIRPTFVPAARGTPVLKSMKQGIDFMRQREGMLEPDQFGVPRHHAFVPAITFLSGLGQRVSRHIQHLHAFLLYFRRGFRHRSFVDSGTIGEIGTSPQIFASVGRTGPDYSCHRFFTFSSP